MNIHVRNRWQAPISPYRSFKPLVADAAADKDPTGTQAIRQAFSSEASDRWASVEQSVRRMLKANDQLHAVMAPTVDRVSLFQRWLQDVLKQTVVNNGQWMQAYLRAAAAMGYPGSTNDEPWLQTLYSVAINEMQGICDAAVQQSTRVVGNSLIANRSMIQIIGDVVACLQNVGAGRSKMAAEYLVLKTFAVATLEKFRSEGHTHVGIIPERIAVAKMKIGDAARKTVQKRGPGGRFVSYTKKPSAKKQREAEKGYKLLRELPEVNVLTAEDDRVCPTCEGISDRGPYEIDHALTLIPAHPNCRCIFLPVGKLPMEDGFNPDQPRDEKGRWTDGLGYREDQRSNERFAQFRNEAFQYDKKGLKGDSTGQVGYKVPVTIPVKLAAAVPGRNDERRVPGDWQYDTLMEDVKKRGFTDETPIMIFVNPKGEAYINEGNTRVAVAKATGVQRISAWIDWKNGSHQVDGPWSPDRIVPLLKPKITKDYDPNQPRAPKGDEHGGEWTSKYQIPDQRVIDVGGDSWNKNMAVRLEQQYQAAKPELAKIADEAAGKMIQVATDDWASLPAAKQLKVAEHWKAKNFDTAYNPVYEKWKKEEWANDALQKVTHQTGWVKDLFGEYLKSHKLSYPFTVDQLHNALGFWNNDPSSSDPSKIKVSMDTYYMNSFEKDGSSIIPDSEIKGMTDAIKAALPAMFNQVKNGMDAPDYLQDAAKWRVDEGWASMTSAEKADYAHSVGAFFEEAQSKSKAVSGMADSDYDPLQQVGGEAYNRTQTMANYMFITRAQQLVGERDHLHIDSDMIAMADRRLWNGWVSSSQSYEGVILQKAIAEEFQGRYRTAHLDPSDFPGTAKSGETREQFLERVIADLPKEIIRENEYGKDAADSAYDVIKSLVRAKWETTQWMLDKSNNAKVELYRGITLPKKDVLSQKTEEVLAEDVNGNAHSFVHLPDLHVQRNGAASTSSDIRVANRWSSGDVGKVTLRAVVPRTAVISVPAYGKNAQNERESVVMGTAWVGWDAWAGDAPRLSRHPLKVN